MSELGNIKKETGFKVPEGYFDNFSKRMENLIIEEKKPTGIVRFLKPLLSAAAIITAVSFISYFAYNNNSNETPNQTAEIITQEEYEEEIYSEEFIIDALANEEKNYTDTIETNEEIIEYLEDEVSYNDLLAEL